MRPVETLLSFANLLTFVVVAVPRLHAACWMGGVVLITLSLAVVQVLLEGPRWQMAPAPIGSQWAHEIINAYSLAFFDKHLKSEPQALLDGPAAHYPEVIFEKRGP